MKKPIILIAAVAACRCRLGRWRQPTRQRRRSSTTATWTSARSRWPSTAMAACRNCAPKSDRVRAGAVLAVLDTRTLALQADQARAQMDAQQQTLLRLRNGSRPEKSPRRAAGSSPRRPTRRVPSRTWRGCAASPPTRKGAASAPRTWTAPAAPRRWPRQADEQREALRLAEAARARKTSLAPRPSCRPRRPSWRCCGTRSRKAN